MSSVSLESVLPLKSSAVEQRSRINSWTRCEEESISDFVTSLQCLFKLCNYGVELYNTPRDCIMCGINYAEA